MSNMIETIDASLPSSSSSSSSQLQATAAGSSPLSTADTTADDELLLLLFIKERYGVSHEAYHELAKASKHLPKQYQLQKSIKELNRKWDIQQMPNGIPGVQQPLESRLRDRLKHLIKSTPDDSQFKLNKKIRVKLSGDGTRIGKHTKSNMIKCIFTGILTISS